MKAAVHVFIRGHVQGVSFRANAWREAKRLGLAGWIKNLQDGSVEAFFEGEEDHLKEMIQWCRTGPKAARVERVDTTFQAPTGMTRFEIR
jgi:acylphosphatase